jgi:hypothetical protein
MKAKLRLCDGCGKSKHIWKNVVDSEGRKRLCKGCAITYEATQGNSHKPTPKKSIASHSAKRAKQETEYNKRARIFKKEHPLCQIGIPGKCTHKTVDVHHEGGKENDLLLKEEWWRAACRPCHEWVTINTEAAIELGYSRPRTTNSDN